MSSTNPPPPRRQPLPGESTTRMPHPNRLIPQQQQQQQQREPISNDNLPLSPSPSSSSSQPPEIVAPYISLSNPLSLASRNSSSTNSIIEMKGNSINTNNNINKVESLPLIHLTRISDPSHLASLPSEFLSNSAHFNHQNRPLLHVDESNGQEYTYYLNPMKQAVFYILAIEMLERFSFYGINYTTTAYLTGEYVLPLHTSFRSLLRL
jgi:hypothetical protein